MKRVLASRKRPAVPQASSKRPASVIGMAADVAEIRCAFDAFPEYELEATIKERGTEADPVTRTYPLTLIMDQPPEVRILPGMTGTAWALKSAAQRVDDGRFEIPLAAVGEDARGARFIWVVDEQSGVVSRREVQVLELTNAGVFVRGLERGELVATAGAGFLNEGQQVRPDLGATGAAVP